MHSTCESETGFAKPLKFDRETVLLVNSEIVQLFALTAMKEIMIKKYDVFILQQVYYILWG